MAKRITEIVGGEPYLYYPLGDYIVVTSFFPLSLIGTCEVERLIVFCGSRPPFQ